MLAPATKEVVNDIQNENVHPIRYFCTHTFIEPPPGSDAAIAAEAAKLVQAHWQRPKYNADCFAIQDTSPVRLFGCGNNYRFKVIF